MLVVNQTYLEIDKSKGNNTMAFQRLILKIVYKSSTDIDQLLVEMALIHHLHHFKRYLFFRVLFGIDEKNKTSLYNFVTQ